MAAEKPSSESIENLTNGYSQDLRQFNDGGEIVPTMSDGEIARQAGVPNHETPEEEHQRIARDYGTLLPDSKVEDIKVSMQTELGELFLTLYGRADVVVQFASPIRKGFVISPTGKWEGGFYDGVTLRHLVDHFCRQRGHSLTDYLPKEMGERPIVLPLPKGDFVWRRVPMRDDEIADIKTYYGIVGGLDEKVSSLEADLQVPTEIDLVYYTHGEKTTVVRFGSVADVPAIVRSRFIHSTDGEDPVIGWMRGRDNEQLTTFNDIKSVVAKYNDERKVKARRLHIPGQPRSELQDIWVNPNGQIVYSDPSMLSYELVIGYAINRTQEYIQSHPGRFNPQAKG